MSGPLINPIQITSVDLKCDAEGCGYEEPGAGLSPESIGKPCPKCGSNLLTEEDYKEAKLLEAAIATINGLVGPVEDSGKGIRVSFNPRGESA